MGHSVWTSELAGKSLPVTVGLSLSSSLDDEREHERTKDERPIHLLADLREVS